MVPASLFKAYIRGGSLWPQKRGGINIFLLSQLLSNDLRNEWYPFVSSIFSQEQLGHTRIAMQALHGHAGIPICVTDETLSGEWSITKAAACRSLLFYARRADPRSGGQPLQAFLDPKLLIEVNDFVANLDNQTESTMRALVLRARNELLANADLSRLVLLTFYSPVQRIIEYEKHGHFYQQANERYGSAMPMEDPDAARGQYFALIANLLRIALMRDFPNEFVEWLICGF